MTSFQLVNHQLKHLFGGIQAQKNTSLQHLQNQQKNIVKSMQKICLLYKKISNAAQSLRIGLTQISQSLLLLTKESKHDGKISQLLQSQFNSFFQNISNQSKNLQKKIEKKIDTSIPNLKKNLQKYTQCAENLTHYQKKLPLLQKQSNKNDDKQRYKRNIEKLSNAQKAHDQILVKVTKQFILFNTQSIKELYCDYFNMISVIGGSFLLSGTNIIKKIQKDRKLVEINQNLMNQFKNILNKQNDPNRDKRCLNIKNIFKQKQQKQFTSFQNIFQNKENPIEEHSIKNIQQIIQIEEVNSNTNIQPTLLQSLQFQQQHDNNKKSQKQIQTKINIIDFQSIIPTSRKTPSFNSIKITPLPSRSKQKTNQKIVQSSKVKTQTLDIFQNIFNSSPKKVSQQPNPFFFETNNYFSVQNPKKQKQKSFQFFSIKQTEKQKQKTKQKNNINLLDL